MADKTNQKEFYSVEWGNLPVNIFGVKKLDNGDQVVNVSIATGEKGEGKTKFTAASLFVKGESKMAAQLNLAINESENNLKRAFGVVDAYFSGLSVYEYEDKIKPPVASMTLNGKGLKLIMENDKELFRSKNFGKAAEKTAEAEVEGEAKKKETKTEASNGVGM